MSIFYVDPVDGSMLGNGSVEKPWSTMQEVWTAGKIKTQVWATPYSSSLPKLVVKNANAPVQPGDTIILLSGYHGDLQILGAVNSDTITVKAAPGATPRFKRVFLRSAVKWTFEGLSISHSYAPVFEKVGFHFLVENHNWTGPSSDISIKNSEIFSFDENVKLWTKEDWIAKAGSAIRAQGNNVSIENVDMRNVSGGIGITSSNNSRIINSTITNTCMDGLQVVGSDNVLVENNTILNVYSISAGNHYDMIQCWTLDGTMTDVIIRGNTLIMSDDPNQPFLVSVQGIGLFDGWFDNFLIENNTVITNSYHGITLTGGHNSTIRNNVSVSEHKNISPAGAPINIYPLKGGSPGSGNTIEGNTTCGINVTNNGITSGTVVGLNTTGVIWLVQEEDDTPTPKPRVILLPPTLKSMSGDSDSLSLSWEYTPEAQSTITGFRLYRDGNIVEVDNILLNARTVSTPRQTDKKSHAYMISAVNLETGEESKASGTALDVYVAIRPHAVEGTLRVEVLP